AVTSPAHRSLARNAAPCGARSERGDRRAGARRVRGDINDHGGGESTTVAQCVGVGRARAGRRAHGAGHAAQSESRTRHVTSRLAPWIAGAVLLAAYVATLAPGVTV